MLGFATPSDEQLTTCGSPRWQVESKGRRRGWPSTTWLYDRRVRWGFIADLGVILCRVLAEISAH